MSSPKRSSDDDEYGRYSESSSVEGSPTKRRRQRVLWNDGEVEALEEGVRRYGEGAWSMILKHRAASFSPGRTATDLKDKWRNLHHAVQSGDRRIRSFVLLDSSLRPILTKNNQLRIMHNKLPRDAALKVASKAEFYVDGATEITIYLRELSSKADCALRYRLDVVHVFRGWRVCRAISPSDTTPKKFQNRTEFWEGKVEKLKVKRLLNGDSSLAPFVDASVAASDEQPPIAPAPPTGNLGLAPLVANEPPHMYRAVLGSLLEVMGPGADQETYAQDDADESHGRALEFDSAIPGELDHLDDVVADDAFMDDDEQEVVLEPFPLDHSLPTKEEDDNDYHSQDDDNDYHSQEDVADMPADPVSGGLAAIFDFLSYPFTRANTLASKMPSTR